MELVELQTIDFTEESYYIYFCFSLLLYSAT